MRMPKIQDDTIHRQTEKGNDKILCELRIHGFGYDAASSAARLC